MVSPASKRLQGISVKRSHVTSKSGTPETHNGMTLVAEAYRQAGRSSRHAVAITMPESRMDRPPPTKTGSPFPCSTGSGAARAYFPQSASAAARLDVDGLLGGAADCDEATRRHNLHGNPAALMALMWYHATDGKGRKDMVILPYKDRLLLFSRYLQQLIMESLGKQLDLQGRRVEQGLTVYGNKGSTDQHAYIQQRDGVQLLCYSSACWSPAGRTKKLNLVSLPATTCTDFCWVRGVAKKTTESR
jgi:glucose-6-phosphate isomerase